MLFMKPYISSILLLILPPLLSLVPLHAGSDPCLEFVIKAHTANVNVIAFSSCGRYFLSGSDDKVIRKWDTSTGNPSGELTGHTGSIRSVIFSPDTSYIVSSGHNIIRLYRPGGDHIGTWRGHSTAIWSMVFHPGGKYIITSSFEAALRLWDITTGKWIHLFEGHERSVLAIALSPDGRFLYSGSLDETIRVWDFNSKETVKVLDKAHQGNIYELAISPDGRLLASASEDNTVKLWEIATGELLHTFDGHTGTVFSVSFSPDNRYLASAGVDRSIKLWELDKFNEIHAFKGHTDFISSVRFSPDGKRLLSGSHDGTVRLWHISPRLFASYYFQEEINEKLRNSGFTGERHPGEKRAEYRERVLESEKLQHQLYEEYYRLYIERLENGTLPPPSLHVPGP
jgi:WD40 repeat protein